MAEKKSAATGATVGGGNVIRLSASSQYQNRTASSKENARLYARAFRCLCLAGGLSAADKQVGAALLSHFNFKSGRCDPSIDRLAGLLGLSRKSVQRAIDRLCSPDPSGKRAAFFTRTRHGGNHHTSNFKPTWQTFDNELIAYEMRARGAVANGGDGTKMSFGVGQNCPINGDKNVLQTNTRTNINELMPVRTSPATLPGEAVKRLLKVRQAATLQPSIPSIQAASDAASDRLAKAGMDAGQAVYAAALALPQANWEAATSAEMLRPGTGWELLLAALAAGDAA